MMFAAFARVKGSNDDWTRVTIYGSQFAASEGLIDMMIEEKEKKHPELEYKKESIQ